MSIEDEENSPREPSEAASREGGCLIVIATPIGNLQDMSSRAVDTLRSVDTILVEDTRTFQTLARRFDIERPLKSYFEHNERHRVPEVLAMLRAGMRLALVSEAGTPAVSDPGYRIVRACREAGLPVSGVPGPSAAILALSISGLPSDKFFFQGFLPQRPGRRLAALKTIMELATTSIVYESPFRIVKTLRDICSLSSGRQLFVGRELTKLHEECVWGTAESVHTILSARDSIKGEIVLVVSGVGDDEPSASTSDSTETTLV